MHSIRACVRSKENGDKISILLSTHHNVCRACMLYRELVLTDWKRSTRQVCWNVWLKVITIMLFLQSL